MATRLVSRQKSKDESKSARVKSNDILFPENAPLSGLAIDFNCDFRIIRTYMALEGSINMEGENMEEKVKERLETLRAGLQADGGDLEFVKMEGKVVYLRLVGHCGSCPFAMMTLKQGIEAGLQEIDPEITVERVEA